MSAASGGPLRWQVGDVTITSICESEVPTSPRFVFASVTKDDVAELHRTTPWLGPFTNEHGYLVQRIHCLVIDTGDMRVAVDTCVGNDKIRQNEFWNQLQGSFLDELVAAGYPADSITHVICTHLHVDHVGWNTRLVDGEWVPTFPNARYLFVDAEYAHWADERLSQPADADDVFGDSVEPVMTAGQADRVPPTHELGDAIAFVPTHGHTPGHVSIEIRSGGERAIITGDMAHSPLQIADPTLSSMFDTDQDEARATRRRVFPGWADGSTLVIGTHFADPCAGRMVADGDGYRLET